MSEPTHIRSDAELARLLGVNRASVAAWRRAGILAWTQADGFDLARCRTQVAERLAGRLRGRTAADSERALAALRQTQTAIAQLRLAALRGSVVPAAWCRAQWAARGRYWREELERAAAELAPGLVDLDARLAALAIEATLRRACDGLADAPTGELPVVEFEGEPADAQPTVEADEAPHDASERWLTEKRLKAADLARLELARVRGSLVDVAWFDDALSARAVEMRRTLQGLARSLPPQLRTLDEARILSRLRSAFAEAVESYSRPLPKPPPPSTTPAQHEDHDQDDDSTATTPDQEENTDG